MTRQIKVDAEQAKELLRSIHHLTEFDAQAHNAVHELIRLVFGTTKDEKDHVIIGTEKSHA